MIRCKKCGTELPENAKFCGTCGTPTEETANTTAGAAGAANEAQAFGSGVQDVAATGAANDTQTFGAGVQDVTANDTAATGAANDTQAFGAGVQDAGAANGAQTFGAGAATAFGAGAQMNGNQQFTNGAQMNQGQQYTNGAQFSQAAPKESAAAYYAKQPYMPPADDAQANKGVAICGYFGLLWIVPLVTTAKHSPFAKFHANQALMVFITSIATWIVTWLLKVILYAIFSWRVYVLANFLSFAVSVFSLVLMIVGIVFAAQGKMKEIPVIGQIHIIK